MKKIITLLSMLVLLTAVFSLTTACSEPELIGLEVAEPMIAQDFTLTYADGSPVSLSDYTGKIIYLYFGYTFCPNVCPSTLLDLKQVIADIGDNAEQVQLIMVTIDPQRDTPDIVAEYVKHFNPAFVGLSGTPDEIKTIADAYGIYYNAHEGTEASGYLVDHTASVILIDKEGNLRLTYPFGTVPEDYVADLRVLMDE